MTTKERRHSNIYWIFSEGGIERDIYRAVRRKQDYTISHFRKDMRSLSAFPYFRKDIENHLSPQNKHLLSPYKTKER